MAGTLGLFQQRLDGIVERRFVEGIEIGLGADHTAVVDEELARLGAP